MALSTIACNFDPNFNNGLPLPADGHRTGINDLFINSSGSFVILTGREAVSQAIRQFMQIWLGEWFFNIMVGVNYKYYLNNSSTQAQNAFDTRIREMFKPFSGSVDRWHSSENWNAYLKFNHSDLDFAEWQTKVINITQTYDAESAELAVSVYLQYGNGATEIIALTMSNQDITIENARSVKERNLIKYKDLIANQDKIDVQIITPDNWIIESGSLIVRLKSGGVYSNSEDIIASEYMNRLLTLPRKLRTNADPYMSTEWNYLSKYIKVINVV